MNEPPDVRISARQQSYWFTCFLNDEELEFVKAVGEWVDVADWQAIGLRLADDVFDKHWLLRRGLRKYSLTQQ